MIIDDEEMIVDVVAKHLENSGFVVMGFSNPFEAVSWYERHYMEVAIIILDMKMPLMSGEDCFVRFREVDPGAKILLFSGYAQDDLIANLLNQGAQGFFQKPVDFQRLISHLGELFSESRTLQVKPS